MRLRKRPHDLKRDQRDDDPLEQFASILRLSRLKALADRTERFKLSGDRFFPVFDTKSPRRCALHACEVLIAVQLERVGHAVEERGSFKF